VFAEDQLPVGADVEDPAGAFDQLRLDVELFPDPARQTGGAWQVVSDTAVGDGHVHADLPRNAAVRIAARILKDNSAIRAGSNAGFGVGSIADGC